MRSKGLLKLILLALVLGSCGGNDPLRVDVSAITVPPVKIKRFDQDLFALAEGDLGAKTAAMIGRYGDFYEGYLANIVCKKGTKDSLYGRELMRYLSDQNIREVHAGVEKMYTDLGPEEEGLREAFRHYRYYFPNAALPVPVAAFTGFNYNIAVSDSIIAFSLEMYLGRDSKFYDMAQFPMYQRRNMNRENIVPDFIKGWMMDRFQDKSKKADLMSEMIYQGRVVYLVEAMLPGAPDSLLLGFSESQLDWCRRNESNMWGFLLKNELLYSTSAMDIAQFTHEGPFTAGFVKESPARTGVWIGWQIVKKYMQKFPKTTLQQLMEMNDAQVILDASGYKPG
jgi:hypothetical protein